MSIGRDYDKELQAILEGLAESVAGESDDQLLAEVRESGQDPDVLLAHVKTVLRQVVKDLQQRPLRDARRTYEMQRDTLATASYSLPATIEDRRRLLTHTMEANPSVGGMLTAQFREFERLEDDDVTSCLKQLAELGLLDLGSDPRSTNEK
jgi:hypothetical protein